MYIFIVLPKYVVLQSPDFILGFASFDGPNNRILGEIPNGLIRR